MCYISSFLSEEECSHVSTALRVSSLLFSPFFALPLIWVDDKLVVQLSKKKIFSSSTLSCNEFPRHQYSLVGRHKKKKKKEKNGIIVLEKRFGVEIVGE